MLKGLNTKIHFIVFVIILIFVIFAFYKMVDFYFINNSEPIVNVFMAGAGGQANSIFTLYSDNKIRILYGDSMYYESLFLNSSIIEDYDGEYDDKYVRKVSRKSREKIDGIIENIKKECLLYDELSFEDSGAHIIYCEISGKIYCAQYIKREYADVLNKYYDNHEIVELVHEFLKYAPTKQYIDGTVRQKDGSYV